MRNQASRACVLLLLLPLLVVSMGSRASATTDRLFHVLTFNVCDQRTGCPLQSDHTGRARDIAQHIINWGASIVYLQEICFDTTDQVRRELALQGRIFQANHRTTLANPAGCAPGLTGNRNFGNAILVANANSITALVDYTLPSDGSNEQRKLTCFNTNHPGLPRGCVTHITPDDTVGAQQIDWVLNKVASWVPQYPEILAGDFNVEPSNSHIDPYYYEFTESDMFWTYGSAPFNEATHDRPLQVDVKYDYIFLASTHFVAFGADATGSSWSDHDPLLGTNTQRY